MKPFVTAGIVGPGGLVACLVNESIIRTAIIALLPKCLVDGNGQVPIRVANINKNRVTVKKGQTMGT